jgi:hypothetical protein
MANNSQIVTICTEELDRFIKEVQANMTNEDANASGQSARSLGPEITVTGNTIRAKVSSNSGVFYSETGRGPYSGGPSGGLSEKILRWMPYRGVGTNLTTDKQRQSLAKFIAMRINMLGTRLFQIGQGRKVRNIYSDERAEAVERIRERIGETILRDLSQIR